MAGRIQGFVDKLNSMDEGPLTDYEKWMPDFMKGLAEGIEKSRA